MAPLVRIICREFPFLTRVFEVFDANYAPEKTGSSGPESLFEVNGRSRKSKSRCSSVQKRSLVWKSPPDSGKVDSDWYVLCFNLAQFNLHSSWHVLGCVNFVLGSPDVIVIYIPHVDHMITWERVLCGFTLWRHQRESFRSVCGPLERLSSFFFALLTCRFARVFGYCRLKKPCETWNQ